MWEGDSGVWDGFPVIEHPVLDLLIKSIKKDCLSSIDKQKEIPIDFPSSAFGILDLHSLIPQHPVVVAMLLACAG